MIALQFGDFPLCGFFLNNRRKELCEAVKDIFITKMNICICNNCPLFQNDMTIFKCGPNVELTNAIAVFDLKYNINQDKKLIEKLNITFDNFQNFTFDYHINDMLNENIILQSSHPREWIRDFIIWTSQIFLDYKNNYRVIPFICGCMNCDKIADVYWELENGLAHVTNQVTNTFLFSITYEPCKIKYKTDIQWIKYFLVNVETLSLQNDDNLTLKTQIPTNLLKIKKLINDWGIENNDIKILFSKKCIKSYFNKKYGMKKMLTFVLIYKELTKNSQFPKLHWDAFRNNNAKNRADKWLQENKDLTIKYDDTFHLQDEIDHQLDLICQDFMSVPSYLYQTLESVEPPALNLSNDLEFTTKTENLWDKVKKAYHCVDKSIIEAKYTPKENLDESENRRKEIVLEDKKENSKSKNDEIFSKLKYTLDPNRDYFDFVSVDPEVSLNEIPKLKLRHPSAFSKVVEPCVKGKLCSEFPNISEEMGNYVQELKNINKNEFQNIDKSLKALTLNNNKFVDDLISNNIKYIKTEFDTEVVNNELAKIYSTDLIKVEKTPKRVSIVYFNKFIKFKILKRLNKDLNQFNWGLTPEFKLVKTKEMGFQVGISDDYFENLTKDLINHIKKNFKKLFEKWSEEYFSNDEMPINMDKFQQKCYNYLVLKSNIVLHTRRQKITMILSNEEQVVNGYFLNYFNLNKFCQKTKDDYHLKSCERKTLLRVFNRKKDYYLDLM
jgi:uncharacterized protein YqkB